MTESKKNGQHVYRLPPCPSYDVEGMESWLADMAQQGLFLVKDGFFAGIATFERNEPKSVKYRLEAAPKSTSMWADNGGEPDPEAVELNEKYHWTYVAKRRNFYIYSSSAPGVWELNTDPKVQALALNAVRKRQAGAAWNAFFWVVLYSLLLLRKGLFLTMIEAGTWFFLFGTVLVLWLCLDSLLEVIALVKLQKKLSTDGVLDSEKNWKKHTVFYYSKNVIQIGLIVIYICILFHNWSDSVLEKDKIPLAEYPDALPFAVMTDFAGEGSRGYRMTMSGMGFNTVEEWSDCLAPRNIKYDEHAEVTRMDGTMLEGGLYIDYHEVISPHIAKKLAVEYYQMAQREKHFQPLAAPHLDVDYCAAYMDELHFPAVILQKENIVIHARFYQTSDNYTMEIAEWIYMLAESITAH